MRRNHQQVLLSCFPATICLIFCMWQGPMFLDDAYITFRYAYHAYQGNGLVFHPGEKVLGTTSPGYALLLSYVAPSPEWIPHVSFILGVSSAVFLVWLLAFVLFHHEMRAWLVLFLTCSLGSNALFVMFACSGMESIPFSCIMLLLLICFHIGTNKSFFIAGLLFAVAGSIRPEAFPLCCVTAVFAFAFFRRQALLFVGPGMVCFLVLFLLQWTVYGSVLPMSLYAKTSSYETISSHNSFATLLKYGVLGGMFPLSSLLKGSSFITCVLGLLLVGFGLLSLKSYKVMIASDSFDGESKHPKLFLLVVCWLSMFFFGYSVAAVKKVFLQPWYLSSLLPLLFLWLGLLARSWQHKPLFRQGLYLVLCLSLATTVLIKKRTAFHLASLEERPFFLPTSYRKTHAYRYVVKKIQPFLRQNDSIAAPEIGVIGWLCRKNKIIDTVGLVTPFAVKLHQQNPTHPNSMILPALIKRTKPDWVITLPAFATKLHSNQEFRHSYEQFFVRDSSILVWKRKR